MCHHGKQNAMPEGRHMHDSTQVPFLTGLKHILSPGLSQYKLKKRCFWGRTGNSEIFLFKEEFSSPMNMCRDTGMAARDPTIHNGCPASSFLHLTLRRRPPLPFESLYIITSLLPSQCYDNVSLLLKNLPSVSLFALPFPLVMIQISPIIFL